MRQIPLIILAASLSLAASPRVATYEGLLQAIRETRAASEARIETAVEQEKVREAWETGKLIDEHILHHKDRADYDKEVMPKLANDLGTSESELYRMLKFARAYPSILAAPPELSWAHYRELLAVDDEKQRMATEKEAADKHWSQRELREEIRRRRLAPTEEPTELSAIAPGPLYTYQIIRLKDRLKVDLGFGAYFDLPEKDAKKFKEGDIVSVVGAPLVGARQSGQAQGLPLRILKDASASDLFTYSAVVTQVVDGDTFHALLDLGFGVTLAQRVRLRRIDAAEIETAEGKEARAYLEKILHRDQGRILMRSVDIDQHGRPIADVWVQGKPVDQELLDQGLAVTISS